MLSIIPRLMVLSFFFNSRILQTGIQQTGPNQFVENQKQNQDDTGRFGMKKLPKRLEFFLPKRLCRNVLFPFKRFAGAKTGYGTIFRKTNCRNPIGRTWRTICQKLFGKLSLSQYSAKCLSANCLVSLVFNLRDPIRIRAPITK